VVVGGGGSGEDTDDVEGSDGDGGGRLAGNVEHGVVDPRVANSPLSARAPQEEGGHVRKGVGKAPRADGGR